MNKKNTFQYVQSIIIIVLLSVVIVLFIRRDDSKQDAEHKHDDAQQQDFSGELKEIEGLEKKVKENPQDFDSILKLAHLYQDTGQLEKSIVNYKLYLEKFPNNADVRIDLGVSYYQMAFEDGSKKEEYLSDAILEMEKALKYEPKHQLGHFNLGIVNLQSGKMEIAKKWLRECISIDPNTPVAQRAMEILNQHIIQK